MKTRGVSKALTLVSLLFLFASCQEEEFYEKDYIDTLKDQYERSQIPDDEAEQAWDETGEGLPRQPAEAGREDRPSECKGYRQSPLGLWRTHWEW